MKVSYDQSELDLKQEAVLSYKALLSIILVHRIALGNDIVHHGPHVMFTPPLSCT